MYCDLGSTIQFSFFTMQFFPPTEKIMIPKYDKFFFSQTKEQKQNFFLLLLSKRISICVVIFYEKSFIFAAHTCEL